MCCGRGGVCWCWTTPSRSPRAPAAIPHALTEPANADAVATFLSRLRGGRTLVVFGSREAEEWLAAAHVRRNVYPLPGLDPQAASVLVARILKRHGGTRHLTDDDPDARRCSELTKLLGGYPLPLTVVLPPRRHRTPAEVLADLRGGGGDADPVGLISRAIEYSHGKLDPATQHSLLLLAPFTATIPGTGVWTLYRGAGRAGRVASAGPRSISRRRSRKLVRVGLAAPHPSLPGWVQIVPVLPYFLRTRLQDHPELAAALAQAHYQLYTALRTEINRLLTSTDAEQRAIGHVVAPAEYANLDDRARPCSGHGAAGPARHCAVEELLDQAKQQTARRQLLDQARIAARPADRRTYAENKLSCTTLPAWSRRISGGSLMPSRPTGRRWSCRWSSATGTAAPLTTSSACRAGAAAVRPGRAAYRQALEICLEFGDRRSAAHLSPARHGGAGAAAVRQAEQDYRQALEIYLEFDDRHSAASTYHQLGVVAQEQRRFAEAEQALPAGAGTVCWSSTTGTAPPAPITNSAWSRRSSGGSLRPSRHYRQALDS